MESKSEGFSVQTLITSNRLDVFTKVPLARDIVARRRSAFSRALYEDYLLLSNPSGVFNEGSKTTIHDYVHSFVELTESMKVRGFSGEAIPFGRSGIVDGAHRLASSIVLDLSPRTTPSITEDHDYDYKFMRRIGLDERRVEFLALQYLFFKKTANVFLLSNVTPVDANNLASAMRSQANVAFVGSWVFSPKGARRIMDLCYGHLPWWQDKYYETTLKERFGDKEENFAFSLIIFDEPRACSLQDLKEEVRKLLPDGSFERNIHGSDNHMEALRIGEVLLSQNSRRFVNSAPIGTEFSISERLSSTPFAGHAQSIESSWIVDGSSILEMFGGKSAKDLDITFCEDVNPSWAALENHKSFYFGTSLDWESLIWDPSQHFIWKGVKYLNLELWAAARLANWEPKVRQQMLSLAEISMTPDQNFYSSKSREKLARKWRIEWYLKRVATNVLGALPMSMQNSIRKLILRRS